MIRRIVVAAISILLAVALPTVAQASASTASGTTAHTAATTTTGAETGVVTAMFGTPNGCPSGDFCVYTAGNGGDLCLANSGNNGDWGGGCANRDQTLFNNGTPGTYDKVRIYWGYDQYGAWACLTRGSYLLYANQNQFNYGYGLDGFGQNVGNNAASHAWAPSCG